MTFVGWYSQPCFAILALGVIEVLEVGAFVPRDWAL
jgi:hypothetical protein